MKYTIKQVPGKEFTSKGDFISFVAKNKKDIYTEKLKEYKTNVGYPIDGVKLKEFSPNIEEIKSDFIEVKAVINTTNIIDSHMDLHLESIWNKTVSDNPNSLHLQEHTKKFSHLLSNAAKSYNEKFKFSDLGVDSDMSTTANINQLVLSLKEHPMMFRKYAEGKVLNHSVGMGYVKISLAVDNEDDEKEREYFEEKLKLAVNPDVAREKGFFWVVEEAKKFEGSAVVIGSNRITPTLWVKNYEPFSGDGSTQTEPLKDTQNKEVVKANTSSYVFI